MRRGVGRARREDLQRVAELPVRGPRAVGRVRLRVASPTPPSARRAPAGAVTRLAADAHLGPRRLVGGAGRHVALHEVGGVAVEAVDVPDLPESCAPSGIGVISFQSSQRFALDVPERPAARTCGRRAASRDSPGSASRRACSRRWKVSAARPSARTVTNGLPCRVPNVYDRPCARERRGGEKSPSDGGFGDRLGHLDVQRRLPARVGVLVARLAGR